MKTTWLHWPRRGFHWAGEDRVAVATAPLTHAARATGRETVGRYQPLNPFDLFWENGDLFGRQVRDRNDDRIRLRECRGAVDDTLQARGRAQYIALRAVHHPGTRFEEDGVQLFIRTTIRPQGLHRTILGYRLFSPVRSLSPPIAIGQEHNM